MIYRDVAYTFSFIYDRGNSTSVPPHSAHSSFSLPFVKKRLQHLHVSVIDNSPDIIKT